MKVEQAQSNSDNDPNFADPEESIQQFYRAGKGSKGSFDSDDEYKDENEEENYKSHSRPRRRKKRRQRRVKRRSRHILDDYFDDYVSLQSSRKRSTRGISFATATYNLRSRNRTSPNYREKEEEEVEQVAVFPSSRYYAAYNNIHDLNRPRKAPQLPDGMIPWSNISEDCLVEKKEEDANRISNDRQGNVQNGPADLTLRRNAKKSKNTLHEDEIDEDLTTASVVPETSASMIAGLDERKIFKILFDILLLDLNRLKEMIVFPLIIPDLYKRIGITPPRGVIFHGPPGTGKTLVARHLAWLCNNLGNFVTLNASEKQENPPRVSFFIRNGAECLSKWIGEAEQRMVHLFKQARASQPSIIFFDEIDGLAPARTAKQDQSHISLVSTLLSLMDGLEGRGNVIVIGATNRIDAIDPALRRPGRFDHEFAFSLPKAIVRRQILEIHSRPWLTSSSAGNENLSEVLDRLSRITDGFSGADLKALCAEASLEAFRRSFPELYQDYHSISKCQDGLLQRPFSVTEDDCMRALKVVKASSLRTGSSSITTKKIPTVINELFGVQIDKVVMEIAENSLVSVEGHVFVHQLMVVQFEGISTCRIIESVLYAIAVRAVGAMNTKILNEETIYKGCSDAADGRGINSPYWMHSYLQTLFYNDSSEMQIVIISNFEPLIERLAFEKGDYDAAKNYLRQIISNHLSVYGPCALMTTDSALATIFDTYPRHISLDLRPPELSQKLQYLSEICISVSDSESLGRHEMASHIASRIVDCIDNEMCPPLSLTEWEQLGFMLKQPRIHTKLFLAEDDDVMDSVIQSELLDKVL